MDGKLLVVVCLALLGIVHGYTLRDILRERALRRLREFDTNQLPYSELETRALNLLREYHFRRLYDEQNEKKCEDLNKDCPGIIGDWENGGEEYCTDPHEDIKTYVNKYCRKTCRICVDQTEGIQKPPFPEALICEDKLQGACAILKDRCESDIKYYTYKYCTKTCNPKCQK